MSGLVNQGGADQVCMGRKIGSVSRTFIDLGDFNSSGSYKGFNYHGMGIRDENMARTFEHEYLGHHQLKKYGGGDGASVQMGKVVEYTNLFRRERAVLERLNYGATGTKIIYGKSSDFGSKTEMIKYIKSVNNGKITPKSYLDK